jgi:hypothetical protein
MRRTILTVALASIASLVVSAVALGAGSGGVTGPAIYVDGSLYRTVGTPTDFSHTGAPASSYETLYDLGGVQPENVAVAAPGDPGFKGGRWAVHAVGFVDYAAALATYDANGSGDFDSAAEVQDAIAGGAATDLGVVKQFECPVIPLPRG